MLAAMIQVVRLAAGAEWMPPRVQLESPDSDWVARAPGLQRSVGAYGGPLMAIAVPFALLQRPVRRGGASEATPGRDLARPLPAADLAGSLRQAIEAIVLTQPLPIELGAEIARTSPRTLRRWLAHEGTSWREIVARVRFETCERLLLDPELTLLDVSTQLGYSDQAHFNRAFRGWTGEAPSVYRRRRVAAPADP